MVILLPLWCLAAVFKCRCGHHTLMASLSLRLSDRRGYTTSQLHISQVLPLISDCQKVFREDAGCADPRDTPTPHNSTLVAVCLTSASHDISRSHHIDTSVRYHVIASLRRYRLTFSISVNLSTNKLPIPLPSFASEALIEAPIHIHHSESLISIRSQRHGLCIRLQTSHIHTPYSRSYLGSIRRPQCCSSMLA